MEDWKLLFTKGNRYRLSAIELAGTRKFSDPVIWNAFNYSAENLLSSLVALKDIFIMHGGVAHLVYALNEMGQVPENIEKFTKMLIKLSLKCSCGKNDLCINDQQMQELIIGINQLVTWVENEIKLYHVREAIEMPAL